jgi:membrane protease YdiL (CAAX protease family)
MKRMRQFLIALVLVWTAACIAAYFYSLQQNIAPAVTGAVLPALLIEAALYLVPGFPEVRKRFDDISPKVLRAAVLASSGVLSYILAAVALGTFNFTALLLLTVLTALASFCYASWYPRWSKGPSAGARRALWVDLLFLAFMAAVFASKAFDSIYPRLNPRVSLEILGRLMWIRIGLLSVLSLRRLENVRFGFVPSRREWKIGLLAYLIFLPVAASLAYALHFIRFQPLAVPWWKFVAIAVGTFLGVLWVLAVGEEFFFRGFLQQLLTRGLRSRAAGLLFASCLFGVAHLWFHAFPNWKFAILAAAAGVFYGLAFMRTGSVRASMVAHALVVSTWKLFFAS